MSFKQVGCKILANFNINLMLQNGFLIRTSDENLMHE